MWSEPGLFGPKQARQYNDDMAAGNVWSRVTCTQIVGSAGCVSFCLFSANWPNEISVVVWLQIKSSEQFGDCPTSRILFMHYCNLEVSGKGQPGEEKSQGSSFTSTKDTCTARVDLPDRRASARLEAIETMCPLSAGRLCQGQRQNQPLEDSAVVYFP